MVLGSASLEVTTSKVYRSGTEASVRSVIVVFEPRLVPRWFQGEVPTLINHLALRSCTFGPTERTHAHRFPEKPDSGLNWATFERLALGGLRA